MLICGAVPSMEGAVGAWLESLEPKLERLTGLVCMLSPVTPPVSGMTRAFWAFSIGPLMCGGASLLLWLFTADWAVPMRLWTTACAGLGLDPRSSWCCRLRSSSRATAPDSGCGDCLGERPRGDLVRWVPKVAPECELGVDVLFGTEKGPVGVGVMARADAAMGDGEGWDRYV